MSATTPLRKAYQAIKNYRERKQMEIPLRDVVQVQGRKRQSTLSDSFFPVTKRRVGNNHEKISDLQAKTTDSIFVAHPKLALPTPKHCLREGKLMRCVTVEALVTSHTLQDGMNRRGASCLECGISTIELFGHVANVRNPQRNKWEFSLVDKPMDTTGPMSLRSDYWEIDHPFPRVLCEGDTGSGLTNERYANQLMRHAVHEMQIDNSSTPPGSR